MNDGYSLSPQAWKWHCEKVGYWNSNRSVLLSMTNTTPEAITAKRKFTLTLCSRSFNSWLGVLEPVAKQNLMVGGCGSSYSPQSGRKNKKERMGSIPYNSLQGHSPHDFKTPGALGPMS